MPRIAAALLALCLLTGLTACNRVYTEAPLFGPEDTAGAPVLRDGVWLIEGTSYLLTEITPRKPCRVDVAKPMSRWPKCAQWLIIRDGQMLQYIREGDPIDFVWLSDRYLLVAGEPAIIQMAGETEVSPSPLEADVERGAPARYYIAIEPVSKDADGRVQAFDSWSVMCGPMPPAAKRGKPERYLTLELHPGLVAEQDGVFCTTTSRDALRSAAAASRDWYGEPLRLRWVRDSYP